MLQGQNRWLAAYYLICRQLIILIVLLNNSSMAFTLQITCIVIATILMWLRPYKNMLINLFDGLMLQLMIVVVTVDASDSLQSVMTELSIIFSSASAYCVLCCHHHHEGLVLEKTPLYSC